MEATDVLVIGGGPAGAAVAIMLARAGRRCAVLESQSAPAGKIGETLAPEARQILSGLGVWENFLRDGHLASPGNCSLWGGPEPAEKNFIFNPHGSAWQLDRAKFEAMLLAAAESAGARVWRGVAVQSLRRAGDGSGGWEVAAAGRIFRAAWLVDASGRGSAVARQLGVTRTVVDRLVAVHVTAPAPVTDTDARTLIEARPDGWWYSARVPGGRRVLAFLTDADLLPGGQAWRTAEWFWQRANETTLIRPALGRWSAMSPARSSDSNRAGTSRSTFDPASDAAPAPRLTSAHSSRLVACHGDGWVAAGDAAQSFDPLSGEGLFHALFSGQCAGQALGGIFSGAVGALAGYAALNESLWRRFLHHRQIFYASEMRWRDRPFWLRRLAPAGEEAQLSRKISAPA